MKFPLTNSQTAWFHLLLFGVAKSHTHRSANCVSLLFHSQKAKCILLFERFFYNRQQTRSSIGTHSNTEWRYFTSLVLSLDDFTLISHWLLFFRLLLCLYLNFWFNLISALCFCLSRFQCDKSDNQHIYTSESNKYRLTNASVIQFQQKSKYLFHSHKAKCILLFIERFFYNRQQTRSSIGTHN